MWFIGLIVLVAKIAIVLVAVLLIAAYLILLERKLLGRFQIRYGPNRVGFFGLLQPIADGIKAMLKEDLMPTGADKFVFLYAPAVTAIIPLLIFAVVPFGPDITLFGKKVPMVITDLNVGLLYVLALTAISVYGVALGGWSSNSRYALLGAIRGAAQMISYELSLGLSLVPIVMLAGSFSMVEIVNAQAGYPFILVQPVAFVIFLISIMAESNRLPFDLPEAESELISGFHTEYSGMRFALYFIGEYVSMFVLGSVLAVFFLGGWRGPFLPAPVWFFIKIMFVPVFMIWTRATLPRLRYDQLMKLGWKFLLPISLLNVLVTGGVILLLGGSK